MLQDKARSKGACLSPLEASNSVQLLLVAAWQCPCCFPGVEPINLSVRSVQARVVFVCFQALHHCKKANSTTTHLTCNVQINHHVLSFEAQGVFPVPFQTEFASTPSSL